MADRLIITNGDSAVARMREAGLEADFLPWRDMLHAGPVPRARSLEELSSIRARYLAEEFEPDRADVDRGFAERDAAIRNHAKYDRVELWFEHDLYDQLQLIHSRSRRLRRNALSGRRVILSRARRPRVLRDAAGGRFAVFRTA